MSHRTITEVQVLSGLEHGPAPEGRRSSVLELCLSLLLQRQPCVQQYLLHACHAEVCARSCIPSRRRRREQCQIEISQDPCECTLSSWRPAWTDHICWIKLPGVSEGSNNLASCSILGEVTVDHLWRFVAHEIAVLVASDGYVFAGECINVEVLTWYSRHGSVYPMLIRRGLPQHPVCTSFAYGSDLRNVSVRELSVLGVRSMPEDGLFGHVSTCSVDMCVIVLITHIVQGHDPCCSHWLLCGLGVRIRGV